MNRSIATEIGAEKENQPGLRNTCRPPAGGKETSCREGGSWAEGCESRAQPGLDTRTLTSILEYLRAASAAQGQPGPAYLAGQAEVDATMRAILVDWLVDVTCKFRMLPQVIFMTVSLIDRFLAGTRVAQKQLQLVGIAALMIVGKYEEIYPPALKDHLAVCCNIYSAAEVLAMESEILLAVDFEVSRPTSFAFLELLRRFEPMEERAFVFCQYFLEIATLDVAHLAHAPAQLAAGAVYLANKLLKRPAWSAALGGTSGVCEARAKGCAKDIFSILERVDQSELRGVSRKYQSSRYFCIAKYRIERVAADAPRRAAPL